MNASRTIVAVLALTLSIGVGLARGVSAGVTPRPSQQRQLGSSQVSCVWFVQNESHLLAQNASGGIVDGDRTLPVPHQGRLFAAAYYPGEKALLIVTPDAEAILYRETDGAFEEANRFTPDVKVRAASVRFTQIPGLAYLMAIDVKKEAELKESVGRQEYADRHYRLELTPEAKGWDGVPAGNPKERLLTGLYKADGKSIALYRNGDALRVGLPDRAAPPFFSGPYEDLPQSVFLFSGKGIVCKTVDGWALCSDGGKLIRWFSTRGIAGWWVGAEWRDGAFMVSYQDGPTVHTLRMDVKTGKLVKPGALRKKTR